MLNLLISINLFSATKVVKSLVYELPDKKKCTFKKEYLSNTLLLFRKAYESCIFAKCFLT
ncbi:hypothetical protein GCM10007963_18140 [Lutibacter litoralis]|nr:hypothetical protein GCM10007963_18140 [Lutibacter litoralis]